MRRDYLDYEAPGTNTPLPGGRRDEKVGNTDFVEEKIKSQELAPGKMKLAGQGPVQNKPARDAVGQATIDLQAELTEARQQAAEALRQQRIGTAQRDLVSDFYKNLVPGRAEPPK